MTSLRLTACATLCGLAALLLPTGCETGGATGESDRGTRGELALIPVEKVDAVRVGMTEEYVRDLLGAPEAKRAARFRDIDATIWVYHTSMREVVTQVPFGTKEAPYINPFSGQQTSVPEADYRNEYRKIYTTLELLMIDGRVRQQQRGKEVTRSYD